MELNISPILEPLTINIGDRSVTAVVDLGMDNLIEVCKTAAKAQEKIGYLNIQLTQAKSKNNLDEMKDANKKISKAFREVIVSAIGQESYDEIIEACGNGHKVNPTACNQVMAIIFNNIMTLAQNNLKELKNSKVNVSQDNVRVIRMDNNDVNDKAAHYLSEVANAQAEPDTEE